MESWSGYLMGTGGLLFFALLVWVGERMDLRRDRRAREAAEKALSTPAE